MSHDTAADRFEIALDPPGPVAATAAAHLRESGFTPVAGREGMWERPIDVASRYTDLIDAERVLLKVAELHQPDAPARKSGRGRRGR